MKTVIFDVRGTIAHFRKPDTTATHLTYPFITPTAAKGLVGSILGITDFTTEDKVGIQLLNPVRTSAQQLSMLGKDSGKTFNRPTTVELLVNPAFRIYYGGSEYVVDLQKALESGHSVYHTYLGVAYAITKPELIDVCEAEEIGEDPIITTKAVIPTDVIEELILEEDRYYQRAGGFMLQYKGNRVFEKSISFLYEKDGKPIRFRRKDTINEDIKMIRVKENIVCLV
jgi:CRISPR-associated protein, Cas5h family